MLSVIASRRRAYLDGRDHCAIRLKRFRHDGKRMFTASKRQWKCDWNSRRSRILDAGRQPALEAKALERSDDITTAQPVADIDRRAVAGYEVDDGQRAKPAAAGQPVGDEIHQGSDDHLFNQYETGRSRVLIVGSWRDSCACDRPDERRRGDRRPFARRVLSSTRGALPRLRPRNSRR